MAKAGHEVSSSFSGSSTLGVRRNMMIMADEYINNISPIHMFLEDKWVLGRQMRVCSTVAKANQIVENLLFSYQALLHSAVLRCKFAQA